MKAAPASLVVLVFGLFVLAPVQASTACYTSTTSGTSTRVCADWMETSRMTSDVSFESQVERFAAHGDNSHTQGVAFLFDRDSIGSRSGAGIGSFNDGMASRHPTSPQPVAASFTGDRTEDGQTLTIESAVSAVPEPATYALFLAGLGAVLFMSRRRRM